MQRAESREPAPTLVARFDQVTKRFGGVEAVSGVQLDVHPGEFLCVVGPSGCGKSTLLNMMAGLYQPTSGEVEYAGHRVTGLNHDVGYLTQRDLLLPWRTVFKNVAFPLEMRGWDRKRIRGRVDEILATVGLSEAAKAYPYQLSGGMRKRVAIARVLVSAPRVLLMDEPFSSLDAQLRMLMHDELLRIWQNGEVEAIVFVTHDLGEAITLADRVVVMVGRPG